ncbi:hypothetical protein [Thiolinea disciformis]|uniref:hypothetical protein n=1 Tax=Thiolinea disciformis TaxID=125614 RepID=UPI0003766F0D|nr:hypothetical protein [Thiolinea disciformis]
MTNNPLSYTDPSGYFFSSLFKSIGNFISNHWRTIVAIAVAIAVPQLLPTLGVGPVLSGAVAGAINGFISTGNFAGAFKGFVTGALSAGMAGAVKAAGFASKLTQSIAHGVSQGALAVVQGAKFGSSFASAFVSHTIGGDLSGISPMSSTVVQAVIGGTISVIGGGKFANGAVTAAFVHMFNELSVTLLEKRPKWRQMSLPYNLDKSDENYHKYTVGPTPVCTKSNICTDQMVSDLMDSQSAPMADAVDGVIILPGFPWHPENPIFHTHGLGWSMNVTLPGHEYHFGYVRHESYLGSDNVFYMQSMGEGIGPNPIVNNVVGSLLFTKMHADVSNIAVARTGEIIFFKP